DDSDDDSSSDGSTVPIPQAALAATINWKRGSRMLPNVEVTYNASTAFPPIRSTTVIGIDPGEVFAMTATRVSAETLPATANRKSVRISRSYLYQPYLRFRTLMEEKKEAKRIDVLESNIPPMTLTTMDEYFQYMST
ncbi:hypothetical protein BGZ99_004087, partial [Dissophora globulifera]